MLLAPIGQSILGGDNNAPTNRLPYNSRQRKPSIDSDSSSAGENSEGPGSDEYRFIETSHSQEVLLGLNELRKEGHFCDVTLSVDGVKFPAHRNVLASFSPYFKAMFTSKLAESRQAVVAVNGVEAPMMSLLLDYAYTSTTVITRANVQSLLSAANLLQVLPVRDAACLFLERHMDTTNCVGIHCFAETHACTELQVKARQFTLENFWEVGHGEEFLGLSPAKLVEFISSDELQVEREETVFQAVIRWFNHNPEQRRADFHKVLEHVRLPLLSPYFLHDCVESLAIVRQSPECRHLVEEAKMYHLLPDRRAELQTPRTKHRNNAGTVTVIVAVGGEDDKVVLRSVECYDPLSHNWRTLACLPFAISKHGLVASGKNTLYLAGGEFPDGSASRSVWRYDPVLDVWQEMAPMLVPRSELGGAILEDGDGIELVERYDPRTNTWMNLAPMLIPRSGSAACVLDGYIYVVGGWHASTENTNKVERYDVQTNTWEFKASMIERRYRPGVAVINNRIYVLGGEEGWDRYHDTIECYSPETDSWQLTGDMPTSRSWLSCVPLQVTCSTSPREIPAKACGDTLW
ncbi:kelch-like protein diablo isoform X3 [Anabrus simplex]|uniref:kelch-like protein diablo isoform X3 n=1 Tax=Anabrus simplex TaxID=316456 RepID=UPI0034DCF968